MQGMPAVEGHSWPLRRHGDEVERLPGGFYVAHGRCDDTMNLGGIKVPICHVTTPYTLPFSLLISAARDLITFPVLLTCWLTP